MRHEPPAPESMPARVREMPTWVISRAYHRAHRLLAEGFATAGMRGYHFRILAALEEFGPASQAALGRRTGIDRSDVVATVNDLAGRGLVHRAPDPDDRRRNVITITPAGSRQLGELDDVLAGVQEKLLAPLSKDERGRLLELLARLADVS